MKHTAIFLIIVPAAFMLAACGPSPEMTPELVTPTTEATATLPATQAPSATPTVVEEASPTPTETQQPFCVGVFKQDQFLYPLPSEAKAGQWLGSGAFVDIIGQLNEPVWYKVRLINQTGWVRQAQVRLVDENCKIPQLKLGEAIGLQGAPILEDTFRDSHNWVLLNDPDRRPDRLPNTVNNYLLIADGYFARVELSTPALENVTSFELATAYWRQNGGDQSSYVGMQFGNESEYFEIRVLGTCEIEIMTSGGFYEKQTTRNDRNICKDEISDFLYVRWDGDGILEVGLNEIENPFRFNIGDGLPDTGRITLVAYEARTQFDFLLVVEN